jgi:hypothetical protein
MMIKGLIISATSLKIFSLFIFSGSEIGSFENKKMVIADKTEIDRNPNFQNSENWLEIIHPKPIYHENSDHKGSFYAVHGFC